MKARSTIFRLAVPADFDLQRAVCSYGYFLLAPNRWDAGRSALHRPLHVRDGQIVNTVVTQVRPSPRPSPKGRGGGEIVITCDRSIDRTDADHLRGQLRRMFRLDEDFAAWERLHPEAARAGFGRLFRSPTFFEDVVKTITTCNVTWPTTIRMNALLCEQVGGGAFPTPEQLAKLPPKVLQKRCKVGYRAERIVRLARDVVSGRLDLARFEDPSHATEDIYRDLLEIYGIGSYAASNLCQLLGRYDRLAIDSETLRHFRQTHGLRAKELDSKTRRRITRHYAAYSPCQFLAYWFELCGAYERHAGNARQWNEEHATQFTAANLRKK